jgi:hypothetical protein
MSIVQTVISVVKTAIAIAFWSAIVIIAFHSIAAMLYPTRYGRVGELMNAVERGKDVVYAIVGVVILLIIIFTVLQSLGGNIDPISAALQAAKSLLVDPILSLFHI